MAKITNSNLVYALYQDNRSNSNHNGEWYARVKSLKTYTWEEFIQHVADHGSVFTRAEISGVMYKMLDCLIELLMTSNKVQFGDLGTFYITIKSKPAPTVTEFNVDQHITATRLRFLPSRTNLNDLSSPALRKVSKFKFIKDVVTENEIPSITTGDSSEEDNEGGAGV